MGGGCFKGGADAQVGSPVAARAGSATSSIAGGENFGPVLKAVGRPKSQGDAQLDEIVRCLASGESDQTAAWFDQWLSASPTRSRQGLAELLRRTIAHAIGKGVTAAEASVAELEEVHSFSALANHVEEDLTVDEDVGRGVAAAAHVLRSIARLPAAGAQRAPDAHLVKHLDRVVLIFRRVLLALVGSTSANCQAWRDFQARVRLPMLEEHLCLLSSASRAALLGMALVGEGVRPAPVVVRRGTAMEDAVGQLPDVASVLLPYFASPAGTKVVRGQRVEGGEGHGPRKEFFIKASADTLERWGPPESAPAEGLPTYLPLTVDGRALRRRDAGAGAGDDSLWEEELALVAGAKVGQRLRVEFSGGKEATRVVAQLWKDGSLSVDLPFEESATTPRGRERVCRISLQAPVQPLFEFHRSSGAQWFGAYADDILPKAGAPAKVAEDLRRKYFTFGKLLCLAIANHCKISFHLPLLFFQLLLDRELEPTIEDLKRFDGPLHSSIRKTLKMSDAQFKELKELECVEPQVTREGYVAGKVRETLCPEAMQEIRRGFWQLAKHESIVDMSAPDLKQVLCPAEVKKDLNIREVFHTTMEEEMANNPVFVKVFWSVMGSLTAEEKRRFLMFLTGAEAPPEPGTEEMVIMLPFSAFSSDECVGMLDMLPQAHTCTNTLELPNYYEALIGSGKFTEGQAGLEAELRRVLGEKLRLAITEGLGYELDAAFGDERHDVRHELPAAQATASPSSLSPGSTPLMARPAAVPPPAAAAPVVQVSQDLGKAGQDLGKAWPGPSTGPAKEARPAPSTGPAKEAVPAAALGVDALLEELGMALDPGPGEPEVLPGAMEHETSLDALEEALGLDMR